MRVVDLRSDTVTLPTPAMQKAMHEAELGDDVFGEDPTVNRLEQVAAERLGKEAALLTVSGTMSNLVALLTHCGRGDEVIMGDKAHTFMSEVGGPAALGSITTHTVPNQPDGTLRLEDVAAAIRTVNIHHPSTRLIVVENTHNRMGGTVLGLQYMDQLDDLARKHGLGIHLDGARVFNASVALGVPVAQVVKRADSVCFCLSKGLACPVGSVLAGTAEFIRRARQYRKMVGGGMRQAGVLAAAGLVALNDMVERLAEDHVNARRLAEGIAGLPGIRVDLHAVQTNIVFFDLNSPAMSAQSFQAALSERGIKVIAVGGSLFRMVTHYGIEASDIDLALKAFGEVTR